ncbi:MAG: hypothetical protein U1E83_10420 [Methylotetracoccus sp.]
MPVFSAITGGDTDTTSAATVDADHWRLTALPEVLCIVNSRLPFGESIAMRPSSTERCCIPALKDDFAVSFTYALTMPGRKLLK